LFCGKVKEFLSQKNIEFTERDVSQDAEALAELETLGVMTTPVTVIDSQVVVGFDRPRLEQLLGA
jgi:glutaredoxin